MVMSCLSRRNVYYIKFEDGEYKVGTIISDKSVRVVSFSEDIHVSKTLLPSGAAAGVRSIRAWF